MLATEAPAGTGRRPFVAAVAGLAVLLVALVPLLGRDALFSADEGAAVAQVRLLQEERGWALDHPLPEIDPDNEAFPLEFATPVARPDGGPAAAPFAKHPAYAVLLTPFDGLAGVLGQTLTSVLGGLLAAIVAGLITRRLAPELAPVAVLVAGVATPLFVDSWVVIAHTLGAALAGAAALAVLRADEGRGGPALLGAAAAMAGAVLLRNEALLFAVALGLTALAVGWFHRRWAIGIAGLAVLGGGVVGDLVDGMLSSAVAGDVVGVFRAGAAEAGFLAGRVQGAVVTLVLPSYDDIGLADALAVVTTGALVATVLVARRRPDDGDLVKVLAVTAAVAAVGRAVLAPEVVPGLLVAAPVVTAGLAALTPNLLRARPAQLLAGTAVLFGAAVLATQYSSGGSGEWGGRYFALGLPVIVPLVVVAGRDALAVQRRDVARVALAAVAVVALAVSVSGARALRATEDRSTELVEAVETTSALVQDPVVVATGGAAPRFAWEDVVGGADWLLVEGDDLDGWLSRVHAQGRDVVVATAEPDLLDTPPDGFEPVGERAVGGGSRWVAVALDRT